MNNNYEIVKQQVNIVDEISEHVQLKRNGKVLKGLCPFHSENTPSLVVYPQTQSYHCFGCEAAGTVIDFVMQIEGFKTPIDAATKLANKYNILLSGIDHEAIKRKKEQINKNREIAKGYYSQRQQAEEYVLSRGISKETALKFGLGYNKENHSITIPILNTYSEMIGMAERYLGGDQPKYKNSVENEVYKKSEILYGLDKARKNIKEAVYIVEGYFDVMALHEFGISQSVAYCGQSLTDGQAKLLSNYITNKTKIYLIPDKDLTGIKNVKKNIKTLRMYIKNRISVIDLPEGNKDINDYLIEKGKFESLQAEPFEFYLLKLELNNCLEIEDEYQVAHEYAKMTPNKMLRADMASYLAKRWNKSIELVKSHMDSEGTNVDYSSKLYTATEAYINYQKMLNEGASYIKSGLSDLDLMIKTMKRKEVMFLMGRGGSGKTTFILNLIYNMIFKYQFNILFNSLELAKESVVPQFLQIHEDLPSGKVERIIKSGEAHKGFQEVLTKLDEHFRVVDEDSQTLKDIENYILAANEVFNEPVNVVFIDYFQYIKSEGRKSNYDEKSDLARGLKALAKRLNVFLICLTQANREGGKSGSEKMDLTAARDTGAIEESADYMLGIYRPAADPKKTEDERTAVQHEMYCQILKNRWGRTGEIKLWFDGMTKRIEDVKGRF